MILSVVAKCSAALLNPHRVCRISVWTKLSSLENFVQENANSNQGADNSAVRTLFGFTSKAARKVELDHLFASLLFRKAQLVRINVSNV